MLKNENQINALFDRAEKEVKNAKKQLQSCVGQPNVPPDVAISAMIPLVLCRSALDHVASGIRHELEPAPAPEERTPYFPIYRRVKDFKKEMKTGFPGLKKRFPQLYNYLESIQPYSDSYSKTKEFFDLGNTFKHSHLVEIICVPEVIKNIPENIETIKQNDPEEYHSHFAYYDYRLSYNKKEYNIDQIEQFYGVARSIFIDISYIMSPPPYWEQAKKELSKADPVMKKLIAAYPGEGITTRGDAFGTLVRSIIGQQVSVKAAEAITQRLEKLMKAMEAKDFLAIEPELLRTAGLSRQKIVYITELSRRYIESPFSDKTFKNMSDDEVSAYLKSFKGIGKWTAEMFLLFYLVRPDIFPIQDIGIQKAIKKQYDISDTSYETLSNKWRPWRTVATWYLWRSLDPIAVAY